MEIDLSQAVNAGAAFAGGLLSCAWMLRKLRHELATVLAPIVADNRAIRAACPHFRNSKPPTAGATPCPSAPSVP